MQIHTWTNTRAPAGYQALAKLFAPHWTAKGKAVGPLPIEFWASTADLARAKAEGWLKSELERMRKPRPPRGGRRAWSLIDPTDFP